MMSPRLLLVLFAAVAFGLGISLPLVRFERLFFFVDTPSLLQVVQGLWNGGDAVLAVLVAAFSIGFPLVKLATVQEAVAGSGRFPAWAGFLAKWSMMDVLLVAILIFAAKTSGLASAVTQPGIWFYFLSAIATVLATVGLKSGVEPKTFEGRTDQ